jgi:hypothetical protein
MATATAALSALLAAVTLASGCTLNTAVPTVSKDALQTDIAGRLAAVGAVPEWVTCKEDLIGEAGRTARCDVVLSPTNSFEPIVTVTGFDGTTINYEVTPAVSKEQLETAVSRLVSADGAWVDSVSCESGLTGDVGAVTHCDVDAGGVKARRTVAVNRVEGLMMNFGLVPE